MERLPGGIRGPSQVTDAHGRAARRGQPRRRIDALPQKVLPPLRHHTSPSWSLESRDRSRTRPPPVARTRASRAERPPPSDRWTRGLHAAIELRISAACHTWRSAPPQGREGYQHNEDDDDDDGSASRAAPRERAPLAAQAAAPIVRSAEPDDGAVGVPPDHHRLLLCFTIGGRSDPTSCVLRSGGRHVMKASQLTWKHLATSTASEPSAQLAAGGLLPRGFWK